MRGVGVISREMRDRLRTHGREPARDRRRASTYAAIVPYAAYDEMEFDVPLAEEGDCYARSAVRLEEMRQAVRIIRQCIDGLPEGDFTAKVPKVLRPPAGEAYAAVESPRGELGVHLISDGSEQPYRMRYRPPALYALAG